MKNLHRFDSSRREFLGRLTLGAAGLALAGRLRGADSAGGSAPKKLGIVLAGLGNYSRGELGPALRLTKHCYLAGVVTGNRAKGQQWAKEYGFPEKNIYSYDTMPQMADNRDIDIVYVVTPNAIHAENCIAAAQAGKHVICEKPFTTTVAEAEAVLAAYRAAKVKHSIGYRLHFDPYHQELMRHGGGRDFGSPLKMTGRRAFNLGAGRWRGEHKLAGGGPLMDLGIYIIQGACMSAGGPSADANGKPLPGALVLPRAVTARETAKTRPQQFHDVEEGINWTMEFANGDTLDAFTSYADQADTFRVEGPKGWLDFKQRAFAYSGAVCEASTGPLKFEPPVNQQARQMDDFALCVREGRASRVPAEMGLRDMKIIEAIYKAAATGKRTLV